MPHRRPAKAKSEGEVIQGLRRSARRYQLGSPGYLTTLYAVASWRVVPDRPSQRWLPTLFVSTLPGPLCFGTISQYVLSIGGSRGQCMRDGRLESGFFTYLRQACAESPIKSVSLAFKVSTNAADVCPPNAGLTLEPPSRVQVLGYDFQHM